MLIILLAAALLAQNDAAPAPAAAQAAKPAKAAKPKLICRSNLATGSRLGAERICKTAEEWDNMRRDSRDTLDNQLRHGLQISQPPNTTNG